MPRFIPSSMALAAFDAAAKHLNFTRAAEEAGMTQSGISRHIKSLEDFLGVDLFERAGPRVVLTDAGRTYAADVAEILAMLERASIDIVRGWKAERAILIGAAPSVASRWLASRMDKFSKRHPDIFFEVASLNDEDDFETTRFDILMLRGRGNWKSCRSALLFDEFVAVVASPSYVPPDQDLAPSDFTKFQQLQNSGRPDSWLKWLRATAQRYKGALQGPRFARTSMLINAAESGLGIAIVPICLVQRELERGSLHMPLGPPVPSGEAYYAVYPEHKAQQPAVLAFRDWLLYETRALRKR